MKFSAYASVVTTTVKSAMRTTVNSACVMPSSITSPVRRNVVMGRTRRVQERSYVHIQGISSKRIAIAAALAYLSDREGNGYNDDGNIYIGEHDLMTATTAAAATSATARGAAR